VGKIVSICYTPADAKDSRPADQYLRVPVNEARLLTGRGIEGCRKGRARDRHINLMNEQTLQQLAIEGFRTAAGEMGEQIIVRGVDVDQLKPGARLHLGESAVLEVNKARTGCDRFEQIQKKPKREVNGRLGQMMCVIEGGTIRIGDPVTFAQAQTAVAAS